MKQSFKKAEKLKSRKLIEQLFAEGKAVTKFPVKLFFMPIETLENHQTAFAVPKRSFKSAVDRNRIKRQLREAYRLQKEALNCTSETKFALLFLYLGKEKPTHQQLGHCVEVLLKKLLK
jgi:ribonuclease P protein component